MNLFSLSDCCHLLAIDPKTLRRWMSLFQWETLPHPSDARIKCVTSDMLQQLAATHRRALPDRPGTHFQQEISANAPPSAGSSSVLADAPTDFPLNDSLLKQLGSLQTQIATLQHQLTRLSDQLQKEQEWQTSQASAAEEKSQESSKEKSQESPREKSQESPREKSQESPKEKSQESPKEKSQESPKEKSQESPKEKSQESSKEKSQESPKEKSQESSKEKSQGSPKEKSQESPREKKSTQVNASAPSVDRRTIPHVLPLVEYGLQDKYVVISPEQGLLDFEPDSPEWFAWLSTLPSFCFKGKRGRFTAHRGGSTSASRSWRASRQIRSRSYNQSLGKTEFLSIAHLEQVAAALQSPLN